MICFEILPRWIWNGLMIDPKWHKRTFNNPEKSIHSLLQTCWFPLFFLQGWLLFLNVFRSGILFCYRYIDLDCTVTVQCMDGKDIYVLQLWGFWNISRNKCRALSLSAFISLEFGYYIPKICKNHLISGNTYILEYKIMQCM